MRLMNLDTGDGSLVLTEPAGSGIAPHPRAELVFHRYGSRYFLCQVWNGMSATGIEVQPSREERNMAKETAGIRPENVVVLAMR